MVEEHQRQQPPRLRLVGGQGELAGEPDRLRGEVQPPPVPGRVDEVEHPQHHGEVAGLVEAAVAQAALGPADPLRHRRLRHEEGVGDLPGAQAADRAQGERHLGGGREVGVAAAEEQEEGVVAALGGHRLGQYLLPAAAGRLAAPRVDQPPHRDGGEPGPRVVRRVLRPDAQRVQQGFLERVLGGVEVLAAAHQAREDPGDEGPQLALVHPEHRLVGHATQPMISRTSIHSYIGSPPGPGPPETNAATSSARSCDSTSIMYQPATRSLVSGCGPSVVTGAASGPL